MRSDRLRLSAESQYSVSVFIDGSLPHPAAALLDSINEPPKALYGKILEVQGHGSILTPPTKDLGPSVIRRAPSGGGTQLLTFWNYQGTGSQLGSDLSNRSPSSATFTGKLRLELPYVLNPLLNSQV